MKIKVIGIVSVLVIGGVIGWNAYLDKQVKKFYTESQSLWEDKRISIDNAQFDMGLFDGKASGTLNITPDLCQANQTISLQFEDTIKRGFGKYYVDSKIHFNGELSELNKLNLKINTEIDWRGNTRSRVVLPADRIQKDDVYLSWSDVTWHFDMVKTKKGYQFTQHDFEAPQWQYQYLGYIFTIEGLKYQADLLPNNRFVHDGTDKLTIKQISVQKDKNKITLNDIQIDGKQKVKNDQMDTDFNAKFASLKFLDKNYQNIQFNLTLKELNPEAFDPIENLLEREKQQCVHFADMQKALETVGVNLLKSGFHLISENNQIDLNGHKATLDLSFKTPKGVIPESVKTAEDMEEIYPMIVMNFINSIKYQFDFNVDKLFLKESGFTEEDYQELVFQLEGLKKNQSPINFNVINDDKKIGVSAHQP